jgi:hypothetical protein
MNDQNNDKSQGSQSNHNHGRNRGGHHRNDRPRKERTPRVQMSVVFVRKMIGRGSDAQERIVSYVSVGDGKESVIGFPKSEQFRPKTDGTAYDCWAYQMENARGPFYLFEPVLPYALSPEEFLPPEEMAHVLTAELIFRMQPGPKGEQPRLKTQHKGRWVFPDVGTTVIEGRRTRCLLRERGTVCLAIPLTETEIGNVGALVLRASAEGAIDPGALRYVVLKTAEPKEGVVRPTSDADLKSQPKREYRNIYDLLSDPRAKPAIVVNDRSGADEINKAFRKKIQLVAPDKVQQEWAKRNQVLPFITKKNAEFFFEAIQEAKQRALDIIEQRSAPKGGRKPREEQRPASEPAPAPAVVEQVAVPPAPVAAPAVEEAPAHAEATPASEPMPVAALASSEEASETAGETVQVDPMVEGVAKEHGISVAVAQQALIDAKCSPVEFMAKAENVRKHFIKYAKAKVPVSQR